MSIPLASQMVGQVACAIPGATRIFHSLKIDFCCAGQQTLAAAAHSRGVELDDLVRAIEDLATQKMEEEHVDWRDAPVTELIRHLLGRFHTRHRAQLPELIRLAHRVEQAHGDRPDCPTGLAVSLDTLRQELESHMMKEEQILFPMLARELDAQAQAPISVMRFEHDHHGELLKSILAMTGNMTPPEGACNTWRALYIGLEELAEDLMQHIHLENNVLFVRSSKAAGVQHA